MRVSEFYGLGLTQPSFEFLDVDIERDTRVFLDPHVFKGMNLAWAEECVSLIQDFFQEVLNCISNGDKPRGLHLLGYLHESNEFHLGLSKEFSQGAGISAGLSNSLWDSLSSSEAVTSGLISDLEDSSLFIKGIGHDRISDATINIVRSQLIQFTQETCKEFNIPMINSVDSGPMWDRRIKKWVHKLTELPIPNFDTGKLILVPKSVVRRRGNFDPDKYLRNFVLPYLQEENLRVMSPLVQFNKSNQAHVTKKSILDSTPMSTKELNLETTMKNEDLLFKFKSQRRSTEPLDHEKIAELTGSPKPLWDKLLASVLSIEPGSKFATDYHRAVQALLTALFYPALDMPLCEVNINEGRKRIDIRYVNVAESGFFHWIINHQKISAAQVIVEAKNYNEKLSNPEFDQLTGRFSPFRGKVGLLCYRGYQDDKEIVLKRCRDAALDERGFVLALDDSDLVKLVRARQSGEGTLFDFLLKRFNELI